MIGAIAKSEPLQQPLGALRSFLFRQSRVNGWNLHVLAGCGSRRQVITLKYEAKGFAPQSRQFVGREISGLFTEHPITPGSRPIETNHYVHPGPTTRSGHAPQPRTTR